MITSQDNLWELLCQSWFRRHGEHSGLCNASPQSLCAQLSYPSFARLYQVDTCLTCKLIEPNILLAVGRCLWHSLRSCNTLLQGKQADTIMLKHKACLVQMLHSLGGWPEGLWYRVDPSGQPRGALVWIHLVGSTLCVSRLHHSAHQMGIYCRILLNKLPVSSSLAACASCNDSRSSSCRCMRVVLLRMTVALHLMPVILLTKDVSYKDRIRAYLISSLVCRCKSS